VRIDNEPDWKAVASLVADAYREVASPRLRAMVDAGRSTSESGWRAGWIAVTDDER
jgi:hypothetical protein